MKREKVILDIGKVPAGNRGWDGGGGGQLRELWVTWYHWRPGHMGSWDAEGHARDPGELKNCKLPSEVKILLWKHLTARKDFKQESEWSNWDSLSEIIFAGCWLHYYIKCSNCLQNIRFPAVLWKYIWEGLCFQASTWCCSAGILLWPIILSGANCQLYVSQFVQIRPLGPI